MLRLTLLASIRSTRFELTFTGKKLQSHDLSSVLHQEAMIRMCYKNLKKERQYR